MFFLMFVSGRVANKRKYPVERERRPTGEEVRKGLKESIWALIFPIILIVGIRFGLFTASEAGAFAVVYAFIIGKFVYKELTWKGLFDVLKTTLADNGVIMFIIMCSGIFGFVMTYNQLPQTMAQFISSLSQNPIVIVTIVLVFIFIAGMFMEATVNTLLLTPIFLPIVKELGIDPVHFGILFMTIITMGGMTPPVGVTMYATCSILKCPVIVLEIIILAFFPQIFMWLPNLIFGT